VAADPEGKPAVDLIVVRENTECLVCLRLDSVNYLRDFVQYVKQETLTQTDSGKEARATRLITEYASRRIGKMAFELALPRPRKVLVSSLFTSIHLAQLMPVLHSKSPSYTNPTYSLSRMGCSERLSVPYLNFPRLLVASIAWALPNK
jgi:hypothetical protein